MTREECIDKHLEALQEAQKERWDDIVSRYELESAVPETAATPELLDGLAQKALVVLLKKKLDDDPSLNQRFEATVRNPLWQQLLVAARVRELARAKIVKKGGRRQLRYDVTELAQSFYGKQLLKGAGLERQRVLDKAELAQLTEACAKVKLALPEAIEPTTTERFFAAPEESA
ncbi:MAG: hypothetical protein QM765_33620 [Myxococcales bacterium]